MINSNNKLTTRIEQVADNIIVYIKGEIDEDAVFDFNLNIANKKLTIDLKELKYINSCGLRNWVNWMKKLKSNTIVVFRNCTRNVVDQLNILEGFGPVGAVVESFFVPYYCESCNYEESILVKRGQDYMEETSDAKELNKIPYTKECPSCKSSMEIDILPQKYFKFFQKRAA
jgi:anti-anti-sigma factor